MISCTEFVPLYSALFKYLEDKQGKEGVVKYWEHIADTYISDRLGEEVAKHGLNGCFRYWAKSLNEEACDFTMILDEDKNLFSIDMQHCPSRGMLNDLKHFTPYKDYCEHCNVLYSRVLKKYGIVSAGTDYSNIEQAKCYLSFKKEQK